MIGKIFWEALSVGLLLYGAYLTYVYIWFSMFRIWNIDITFSKVISGILVFTIVVISAVRWFIKKYRELEKKEG